MQPLPVILESQDDMSVVDGATIEPRIRINRPDDENTRCRVSSVRGQPKDFSQLTQPPTTLVWDCFRQAFLFLYSLLLREGISQSAAVETIRGELAIGRVSTRRNLVYGGLSKDPNHDAVMRIGSEAPR